MQYARMLTIFKIALPVAWAAALWAEVDVLAGQVPAAIGTFVALVATLASLAALIVWAVARIAELTEQNRAEILTTREHVDGAPATAAKTWATGLDVGARRAVITEAVTVMQAAVRQEVLAAADLFKDVVEDQYWKIYGALCCDILTENDPDGGANSVQ